MDGRDAPGLQQHPVGSAGEDGSSVPAPSTAAEVTPEQGLVSHREGEVSLAAAAERGDADRREQKGRHQALPIQGTATPQQVPPDFSLQF